MRKVRNITVAVDPELYRQTRRLAAEYNTSVTERLRFLLLAMPEALAFSSPTLNAKDAFRMGHPACSLVLAKRQRQKQPQILRLTTPELKDVRGPVRSG